MLTNEEARLAEPEAVEDSQLEAWRMDDSDADQRCEHRRTPNEPVSVADLRRLGVLSWHLNSGDGLEDDPQLAAIRKARGYSYQDVITVSPDTLPEYEKKIKSFYEEHMHTDEEIRFLLDGSGYFDVRDFDEQWVRIACRKGTMIVLPEGIYHRFTLDEKNYAKAMRLFVGEPVWTPLNRPQEDHPSRAKYTHDFTKAVGNMSEAAVGA